MLRAALACSMLLLTAQAAKADFIVPGSFTNVGNVQTGGTITSAVANTVVDGQSPSNVNTVNISVNFSQIGVPVVTTFSVNNSSLPFGTGATQYVFTVNVTNSAVHPINGYDLTLTAPSGYGFNYTLSPLPTSGAFAFESTGQPLGGTTIRFGGLSGGGGQIGQGGSTTTTLVVDVLGFTNAPGSGTFGLSFTANPEPTSLLLASSLLIPGAWFARRRKMTQTAPKTPAA